MRTVVACGSEKKMQSRYGDQLYLAEAAGIKKNFATGMGTGGIYFFMFCTYALGFWFGGEQVISGEMQAGDVLNVFFAVLIASFSLGHSAPDLAAFAFAMGAGATLYETIDRVSSIDPLSDQGVIPKEKSKGEIEFKNVKFTYPSRKDVPILHGIDLKVEAGKTVALVGSSGSGKSTIIQLIERFYAPDSGSILLDGEPIDGFNLKWLRGQIGLVSQEPILFDATVYQNVAHGLAGTDRENISEVEKMKMAEDACRLANAHDFISKLPKQYQTPVGERGLLMSGGQVSKAIKGVLDLTFVETTNRDRSGHHQKL